MKFVKCLTGLALAGALAAPALAQDPTFFRIGTGGAEGAARVREIEPGYAGQGVFGRMQPDYVRLAGVDTGMRTARAAGFQW